MANANLNKIKSEANLQGWLGNSMDKVLAMSKTLVEQEYSEKFNALRLDIASYKTRLIRLQNRSAISREYLAALMAKKYLSAPFEWMIGKIRLAYLARSIRRIEKMKSRATDELEQLRERSSSRIAELQSEIQLAYQQGQSYHELSGGTISDGNIRNITKEAWDEI